MISLSTEFLKSLVKRMLLRTTVVCTLSFAGLLAGIVPQIGQNSSELTFSTVVHAQTPEQVAQYARAAYEIEQTRQRNYATAKRIMGGNVPGDVCQQRDIPDAVHDICNDFLKRSAEIIKRNGLTVSQFNDITRRKERDPALKQQIQQELLRIQR